MIRPLSDLPSDLQSTVRANPVILFDGECVFCSRGFQFVLRRDKDAKFRFVLAQSPLGARLYHALDLPVAAFETNLVITGGLIFTEADAFAAVMRDFGGAWRLFWPIRYVPQWFKSPAYHLLARNRYRWFGKLEACMLPAPEIRSRFLENGFAR